MKIENLKEELSKFNIKDLVSTSGLSKSFFYYFFTGQRPHPRYETVENLERTLNTLKKTKKSKSSSMK